MKHTRIDPYNLTLASLQDACTHIQYFGLGFIQIKCGEDERVHVYTPTLPRITPEEEVHNHRYDFTSYIVKGVLTQEMFTLAPGDMYEIYDESCTDRGEALMLGACNLRKTAVFHAVAGSSYDIDKDTYHRVHGEHVITYLKRNNKVKSHAQVVRAKGVSKVCPFSIVIPEEELWRIVARELTAHDSNSA